MRPYLLALLIPAISFSCNSRGTSATPAARDSTSASSTSAATGNASGNLFVAGDNMRFVEHSENLPPGFPLSLKPVAIRNPHEGDANAIATGGKLFIAYNCLDCHGAEGSGAMGPSFQDGRWHFGGSAGEVFESIYQGRPDGMPAWGGRITDDQIWMLTAYVRSLSSKDLSTENFSGKTVERTGH
ncbi:MAG TPA: c-type cytochrome [Gemmatimonadaceae bacterium]